MRELKLRPLTIGGMTAKRPIIQGGMGVGISLSSLAGAVAREGGIGIISTAQIGFREPDFDEAPLEANLRAIGKELAEAREIAPDGIIGFNIMVATREYEKYVAEAVRCKADLIISGAGLPVDLPKYTEGSTTKIAPIVSTVKSASVILKLWDRHHHRVPDLVVIEGPKAGGHLGFSKEQLEAAAAGTWDYDEEIRQIIALVQEYENKYNTAIPVVTAGGIYTNEDVLHQLVELGADGVQVATRFVTTEECDAPPEYKQSYINARKEDIVITQSPVGMPGRAIRNEFLKKVGVEKPVIGKCHRCLAKCKPDQIPYCITEALVNAASGRVDNALLFCGENAWRAEKIQTVSQVMEELCGDKEE